MREFFVIVTLILGIIVYTAGSAQAQFLEMDKNGHPVEAQMELQRECTRKDGVTYQVWTSVSEEYSGTTVYRLQINSQFRHQQVVWSDGHLIALDIYNEDSGVNEGYFIEIEGPNRADYNPEVIRDSTLVAKGLDPWQPADCQ